MSAPRYTTATVRQARDLAAAGWSAYRIAKLLGVSRGTVRCWTDPAYDDRRRRRQTEDTYRRRRKAGARWGHQNFRPETIVRRVQELHAAGVSKTNVARVMALDFGGDWTRDTVQTALDGGLPRTVRALRREREHAA